MLYVLKCFLFSFSMYKYVVLPPLNYTRFIPFLGVMVAEFCSLWQQNDTIQMLLCLIPPRCFAYPVSPCHRFRPFRCTSFLLFVVFSPHSSLLTSAVTAVVLRVLMLFFLCLALFVLLSVLLAVICARPLHFFCSFLLLCSTITESLLYVQQLHQRQRYYKNVHRKNQARRSRGEGLGPPPPPPLLLEAAVGRHHQGHPGHQTNSQGARDDPRARVGEAVRNRPGHLQGLLRCAASYVSSQTSKTIYRRPPPKTLKCRIPLKELDHLAVTSMLLQKREPLPVDKAHLLHVNRLPYHSIYFEKRDPPPAVKPTPVPIDKPDLLPVENF